MQIPYPNPAFVTLAFVQLLLLFLRYLDINILDDTHWGLLLIPTFLVEFYLVIVVASEALIEGANERRRFGQEQSKISYTLLILITTILLLLTTVLFVFYLDDETDVSLFWVTTTFFLTTVTFFATGMIMIKEAYDTPKKKVYQTQQPYESFSSKVIRLVIVISLVLIQGFFFWLYNSPWGRVFKASLFWVVLPTIILLVVSFYVTAKQTYRVRTNPPPQLVKQISFALLLIMLLVTLLLIVLHLDYGLISNAAWIALPVMIFMVLFFPASFYVFWIERKIALSSKKNEEIQHSELMHTNKEADIHAIEIHGPKDSGIVPSNHDPSILHL